MTEAEKRLLAEMAEHPQVIRRLHDARLAYKLKRPAPDGSTHLLLTPLQLRRLLAALVPSPRVNLTHFHGAFAPNASLRPFVVPEPSPLSPSSCSHLSPPPAPSLLLPSFLTPPASGASPGLTFSSAPSNNQATACRAREVNGPVRITHPFHPMHGQVLDFVELRARWGEERIFYRDRRGHLASLPARWTSAVPEDAAVAIGAGRAAFRAQDLLELTALLADLQR